jgi:hypothetical protein
MSILALSSLFPRYGSRVHAFPTHTPRSKKQWEKVSLVALPPETKESIGQARFLLSVATTGRDCDYLAEPRNGMMLLFLSLLDDVLQFGGGSQAASSFLI